MQQQLRANADAKQEELRLMVGERYRDLLQASTSIISIAKSSQGVQSSLAEASSSIRRQHEPPVQKKRTTSGEANDVELQMLQQLSAHIKLLLDTPEHLWRMMEKRQYYTAAWLFLLARVVHRALLEDGEDEEESWGSYDIQVANQFPLVTRQWEIVSQFRSQIIQKATMSLREYLLSPEEACSALVTLHLLESRPLLETLSVLLSQRARILRTMFSWPSPVASSSTMPTVEQANGHAPDQKPAASAREIRQATHAALEAIARTVTTVHTVYHPSDSSKPLISQVLHHIQADHAKSSGFQDLPHELQLTTQSLLHTLPSSTHFAFLPDNLRLYKPYVDLHSSSTSICPSSLEERLDQWFQKAVGDLKDSSERWVGELTAVKDVWNVRTWIRKWLFAHSNLKPETLRLVSSTLDGVYRTRVVELWEASFVEAEQAFRQRLTSALESLKDSTIPLTDKFITDFLFQSPPLPGSQATGVVSSPTDAAMDKYQSALRKRLVGRTRLLDEVLAVLENCVGVLQRDLAFISAGAGHDEILSSELQRGYQSHSETLFSGVYEVLESCMEQGSSPEVGIDNIDDMVLLSRVTNELATSSFAEFLVWERPVLDEFRQRLRALHDKMIDRWRTCIVSQILERYLHAPSNRDTAGPRIGMPHALAGVRPSDDTSVLPSLAPSPSLVCCLVDLSNAIQRFGVREDVDMGVAYTAPTVRLFVEQFVDGCNAASDNATLWNFLFLRLFVDRWSSESEDWKGIRDRLDMKLQEVAVTDDLRVDVEQRVWQYLLRTQLLFASMLPFEQAGKSPTDKLASLLSLGLPEKSSQDEYKPAIQLAKPSPRFGLLLVSSTNVGSATVKTVA